MSGPRGAAARNFTGVLEVSPQALNNLGVKIPDTVILEKGKPRKRYCIDATGKLLITRMKTSAELLRVLRDLVKRAHAASRARADGRASGTLRAAGQNKLVRSQSAAPLRPTSSSVPSWGDHGDSAQSTSNLALTEVAVLYFHDGAVRTMTSQEALAQMQGVSKLPKEFWQHIRMLQAPVVASQSRGESMPTRYITYNFDARSGGCQPQAPLLRGDQQRTMAVPRHEESREGQRVAAVPRKISSALVARRKGEVGAGIELVSGQLEFVQEEGKDGTLWLVNASRLECQRVVATEDEEAHTPSPREEIRYFREEQFENELDDHEELLEKLRMHFKRRAPTQTAAASEDTSSPAQTVGNAGASPQVTKGTGNLKMPEHKMPEPLSKFYEAEHRMLEFYDQEIRGGGRSYIKEKIAITGPLAVGLACWWRRWVRGCAGIGSRSIRRPRAPRAAVAVTAPSAAPSAIKEPEATQTAEFTKGRRPPSAVPQLEPLQALPRPSAPSGGGLAGSCSAPNLAAPGRPPG
eukprot:gnl/TRDRNA2_/TRDRNA2_88661_c1_seq2.p1 gnl/TRDRNA2_/TRDRNA2_88661_c1~~gnl/TRDRNA2_/TRDRNA2_88661_c1_seq2.p1  ORF type:complete len:600 (+),score=95.45 gnl/TRDRNA2_/TRDRNA2_88661_c1_seq2:239-1801(+)